MAPRPKPVGVSITFTVIPHSVLIYIYNDNGYISPAIAFYNFVNGSFVTSNLLLLMNYDSATSTMTLYRQSDGPGIGSTFPSAIVIPIYDIPDA